MGFRPRRLHRLAAAAHLNVGSRLFLDPGLGSIKINLDLDEAKLASALDELVGLGNKRLQKKERKKGKEGEGRRTRREWDGEVGIVEHAAFRPHATIADGTTACGQRRHAYLLAEKRMRRFNGLPVVAVVVAGGEEVVLCGAASRQAACQQPLAICLANSFGRHRDTK